MSLSIKVFLVDLGSVKTIQYPTDMFVTEIIKDIRAKHNYGEGGLDHGLLFVEQGVWLSPNKMLGHYDLKFGDVLEFKKKHRILKVKTLDNNVKNILVDESTNVKAIVEVICQRIGLANSEEYSLMKEEKEEVSPKKEKKKVVKTDAHGWLNPDRTLREQGLTEEDFVILKKKFFVTDQNVDRTDPVQLVMMYTQSYDMIISGKIPCTAEEAAQFGGVTMQIKYGNQDPERHKPGFAKMKELVPIEYVKNKEVEKAVYREHSILQGTTELNAKFRYVQLIRSLKSYGTSFFLVREPADKAKKKKAENMLLGVTKQAVVRMTIETKQIVTEWKLTHLRRWAATPKSFTLDFGDYSDSYYQVETEEGEEISRLISGYIEILVKKKNQLATMVPEQNMEEKAVVEEYVRPEKSSKVAIVSNQAAPKQAKSLASVLPNAGAPVEYARPQGAMAENMETVAAQEMLLRLIKNGLESLGGSLRDLGMPLQLPVMKMDPAAEQWKNDTNELNAEALAAHLANLLASIAALVQHANGKVDEMDYDKLGVKLVTAVGSVAQSSQAIRVLSSLAKNDEEQEDLIEAGKGVIEAMSALLKELQPIVTGHKILVDFHNSATSLSSKCNGVLMMVDQMQVSELSQSELLSAASDVGNAIANLVNFSKVAQESLKNKDDKQTIIKLAQKTLEASNAVIASSAVLASVISEPVCREQLIDCAIDVRDRSQALDSFCEQLDENLADQLRQAILDAEDALSFLVEKARSIDFSLDTEIGSYHNQILDICAEMGHSVDNKEQVFGCAKDLTVNATRLVECLKIRSQQLDSPEETLNLQDEAKKLADLTAQMVAATRGVISNPCLETKNQLLNTIHDLQDITMDSCAPFCRSNLIQTLARVFKGTIGTSNLLMSTAQQTSLTNRDRSSQMQLNKIGKHTMELIPSSVKSVKSYQKDPINQVVKLKMIEKAKEFIGPAQNLADAGKHAAPNVGDAASKAQLLSLSQILHEEVQLLASLLENESAGFDGAELKEAIAHVLGQDDIITTPLAHGPLDIQTAETQLMEKAKTFNMVFQNISNIDSENSNEVNGKISGSLASLSGDYGMEVRSALTNGIADFQNMKNIIGSIDAGDNPELRADLLHASTAVGDVLSKLVNEVSKGIPSKDNIQKLAEEANTAVTNLLGNLPRQKAMADALGTIRHLTTQLEQTQKFSSSTPTLDVSSTMALDSGAENLQNDVFEAVSDLTSAVQGLLHTSKSNPAALKDQIQNLERGFGKLIEVSETMGPDAGKYQVNHSVHTIGMKCDTFLNALQSSLVTTDDPSSMADLVGAASFVSESVNELLGLFSSSNQNYEHCSKAAQILNNAASRVAEVNYAKPTKETFADAQFWTAQADHSLNDHFQALQNAIQSGESGKAATEIVKISNSIFDLINHASLGAHLLCAADPHSRRAVASPVDLKVITDAIKESKFVLTKATVKGQGHTQASMYEDAQSLSKNVDYICNLIKPATADANIDASTKSLLKKAILDLADSTSALVSAMKQSATQKQDGKESLLSRTKEELKCLDRLEDLLKVTALAGVPAKPSAKGHLLQAPILENCDTSIAGGRSILSNVQAIVATPNDDKAKSELYENIQKLALTTNNLVQVLANSSPAYQECNDAKRAIEASVALVVTEARKVEAGENSSDDLASGNVDTVKDALEGTEELINQILGELKNSPQNAVKQIQELPERFDFLTKSTIGILPLADQQEKLPLLQAIQNLGKLLNEGVGKFQQYLAESSEVAYIQLENEAAKIRQAVSDLGANVQQADKRNPDLVQASKDIENFVKDVEQSMKTSAPVPVVQAASSVQESSRAMIEGFNQVLANQSSQDIGGLAKMAWTMYQSIGTGAAVILSQTDDEDVQLRLKEAVKDLGSTALDAVHSLQHLKNNGEIDAVSKSKLNQATKEIASKSHAIEIIVSGVASGIVGCEKASIAVDKIVEELDNSITFAKAKQLNPVSETDNFAQHKDSLLLSVRKLSTTAHSFSNAQQLPQESLATLVSSARDCLQELRIKSNQSAAALSSNESEMQESLLECAKTIGIAMKSLIEATKNASGSKAELDLNVLQASIQNQVGLAEKMTNLIGQIEEHIKHNDVVFQTTIDALFSAESVLNNSDPALGTALPAEVVGIANEVTASISKLVANVAAKSEQIKPSLNQVQVDFESLCRAGKASILNAPADKSQPMLKSISMVCNSIVQLVQTIQMAQEQGQLGNAKAQLQGNVKQITFSLNEVVTAAGKLVPDGYVDPNDPNVIAERELLSAANAIEAAARKLASLQKEERPRQANEDLHFEEQILEAAKAIAAATSALVRSATGVQREIVAKGKSQTDKVYFSDGTWNEGLVSAAKLVVGSTNELCESANQFVKGESPIEKVIVCSKSVSSCTVQLLSAAAVKSDPNSAVQMRLRAAGKAVTDSTEQLVIASKNTRPSTETNDDVITPTSIHKNKILEMEIQMKILKLEKELEQARSQLATIRRERYNIKPTGKPQPKSTPIKSSTPRSEVNMDLTQLSTSSNTSVKTAKEAFAKRATEQTTRIARPITIYTKKKNL